MLMFLTWRNAMPKDPAKNVDHYKIRGGQMNEFEFRKNQAAFAKQEEYGGQQYDQESESDSPADKTEAVRVRKLLAEHGDSILQPDEQPQPTDANIESELSESESRQPSVKSVTAEKALAPTHGRDAGVIKEMIQSRRATDVVPDPEEVAERRNRKAASKTASRRSAKKSSAKTKPAAKAAKRAASKSRPAKKSAKTATAKKAKTASSSKSSKKTTGKKAEKKTASRKNVKQVSAKKSVKKSATRKNTKQASARKSGSPTKAKSLKTTKARAAKKSGRTISGNTPKKRSSGKSRKT